MTAFADGTAVLFGGVGVDGYMDDVYTLNVSGTNASWVSLSSQGDTPSARYGHGMMALADGTAVLFGGRAGSIDYLNDVSTLTVSGTNASWASLTSQGDTPSERDDHSMTELADGTWILFGGYERGSYLKDVYTLNVSGPTASWALLNSYGDTPIKRVGQSMVALADGTAVLFGGYGAFDGYLDDVYTLTLTTPLPTPSPTPTTVSPMDTDSDAHTTRYSTSTTVSPMDTDSDAHTTRYSTSTTA